MTLLRYSFNGGTNGVTATLAQTQGDVVAGDNAFDGIFAAPSGGQILRYSNVHPVHGGMGLEAGVTTTSSSGDGLRWSTSIGTLTEVWWRTYLWTPTANPPGATGGVAIVHCLNGSLGNAALFLGTGGVMQIRNVAGGTNLGSLSGYTAGQQCRIDGHFKCSSTSTTADGYGELDYFTGGNLFGDTPNSQLVVAGMKTPQPQMTNYQFGAVFSNAQTTAWTLFLDELMLSDSGPLPPAQEMRGANGMGHLVAPIRAGMY